VTGRGAATVHATAVALNGRAVLIRGASGSGKSALALHMIALGAGLIADDRTHLSVRDGTLTASAPATLPALIEARFIGLLPVPLHPAAPVLAVVDMDRSTDERLPPPATCDILTITLPLFAGDVGGHLGAALFLMLKTGSLPIPCPNP
jgi:HPr kinase/phosphorylase